MKKQNLTKHKKNKLKIKYRKKQIKEYAKNRTQEYCSLYYWTGEDN